MFNYAQMPGWYDWAYSLSEAALLLLCMGGVAVVAALATLSLRVYRGRARGAVASSLPPAFVTAIVLPASVVIGMLVNDVWRKYSDAQDVVVTEAGTVADATRAIHRLPAAAAQELNGLMHAYVHQDLARDWEAFQTRRLPVELRSALQELEYRVQQLRLQLPNDLSAQAALGVLADDVAQLDRLRKQRIQLSMGRIDTPRWVVLGVLLFCAMALMGEVTYGQRRNFLVTAMLFVLSYGSLVYMLLTHDRPFSGETVVTSAPIVEAYSQQLKALPAH